MTDATKLLKELVDSWKQNVRDAEPIEWDLWDEFVCNKLIPKAENILNRAKEEK